ncbi:MAG: hypothetical protein KTR31_09325 [Myxococcales bacterium]|nr:hypothetical protein [Myxococcales bacterium]
MADGPHDNRVFRFVATLYFLAAAAFSLLALTTQFPDLAAWLPRWAHQALVFLHFPLLMVAGLLESRLSAGDTSTLPTWMRIPVPARATFAFGFAFFAVVFLRTWDLEIGPVDPTPPESWPLISRLFFFFMFTVGMAFANYLAAAGTFVPALRLLNLPIRDVTPLVGVPISAFLGTLLGGAFLGIMSVSALTDTLALGQSMLDDNPMLVLGLLLVPAVVPSLLPRRG